jgi:2-keto-4-pentenoate hydratase
MKESSVAAAARIIADTRRSGGRLGPLPGDVRPLDEPSAYAVQDAANDILARSGSGAPAGHKIGCTTPVMQAYLGIPNPCAGIIFDPSIQRISGTVEAGSLRRLGVECEIAVEIGTDLDPRDAPYDIDAVASAVRTCMAAIEIVEDRYVDYTTLDTPTLIADDFFAAGCVLGPPIRGFDPRLLGSVTATMTINDTVVGSGVGTDVLGEPLEALRWLAAELARRGRPLRTGSIVLLGSLVQTHWVAAGDEVAIANDPLGTATLSVV